MPLCSEMPASHCPNPKKLSLIVKYEPHRSLSVAKKSIGNVQNYHSSTNSFEAFYHFHVTSRKLIRHPSHLLLIFFSEFSGCVDVPSSILASQCLDFPPIIYLIPFSSPPISLITTLSSLEFMTYPGSG